MGAPRRRALAIAGACAGVAALMIVAAVLVVQHHERGVDHRFVIPAGTAARIAAGDDVNILPAELHVAIGDTLTVVNHDDTQQTVGVLTVPAGETRTYRFPHPGQYVSVCTIHRNGSVDIIVDS